MEIGTKYKLASNTITESCWNQRTKWVIMAQCNQFNVGTEGDGPFLDGNNSAYTWAQTMLGDGERLHGFLGYYGKAPEGEDHTTRLTDFLLNTTSMTLIDAWKEAHPCGFGVADTNWAVMYYANNVDDRINSFTASTPTDESATICLERREIPAEVYSIGTEVSVLSQNTYPLLVDNMDASSATALCAELQSKVTMNDDCTLEVDANNRIIYNNHNNHTGEASLGMNLTDNQVIQNALQELEELGLSPDGEYRTSVSYVRRYQITDTGTGFENPEDIEYTVCFYRTYNGIDIISDQEDGIVVSFNKYGLTELQYHWRDLQIVTTTQPMSCMISEAKAKSISQATLQETDDVAVASNSEPMTNAWITYVQSGDDVKCVWVCSPNGGYGNNIFIDVNTGEQIDM